MQIVGRNSTAPRALPGFPEADETLQPADFVAVNLPGLLVLEELFDVRFELQDTCLLYTSDAADE